jgi:putative SOS response-associated peptidase YedK
MCGRYTLTRHDDIVGDLEAALGDSAQGEWWKPRFNVAPTQPAPVVVSREGARVVELFRWGLVPFWGGRAGARPPLMINARVESVGAKAVFRDALDRKRCLVPADGFFEWLHEGKAKRPVYLHPSAHRTIAFAGLWARARTDAGELYSFTIITGAANSLVAPIHDRMPIVLDPAAYATWLDPAVGGDEARTLLTVPPVADWTATPVSSHVNSAQHDDPTCIVPA